MKNRDEILAGAGVNTRLAHAGNDPADYHGFVNPPVVHASTVLFPNAATMENRAQKYTYGTRGTPTTDALCAAIDELEGSAGTILVPSGLAAVTVPFLAFLSAGGSKYPIDLLKDAGVDMTTDEPLDLTMAAMNRAMDEIEQLNGGVVRPA